MQTHMQTCKHADMQTCRHANMQTCEQTYADMQTCTKTCKHAWLKSRVSGCKVGVLTSRTASVVVTWGFWL